MQCQFKTAKIGSVSGLIKRLMKLEDIVNLVEEPAPKKEVLIRKYQKINMSNKLSPFFSGALRTFTYFMASGTHYNLEGIGYISLYGEEPSAIEKVYAIYANVIELDEDGRVLNDEYAQKRATDYLRQYCDPSYKVLPEYQDWEIALY
jgi:hypothetical protein